MKNTLSDLNNHLFAAIERLGDEDMKPEQIETEVQRSKAIADTAKVIITNGALQLKAQKLLSDGHVQAIPKQLTEK